LAALGLGVLAVSSARAAGPPPPGKRIDFSQPTSANDVISTNLSRFKPITDAVPQLEPRTEGALDFLRGESSQGGLPFPEPEYMVTPNPRLKERLERRKNWAAMTPEEMLMDSSTSTLTSDSEDSSKAPGRPERDKRSRLDYSSTARQQDRLSPDSSRDADGPSASRKRQARSDSSDEADLPEDIRAAEKQLKDFQKSLRADSDSSPFSEAPRAGTGFSEFFGFESQKSSWVDEVKHHKAVMEQFKQAIESPLDLPLSSSFTVNPFDSVVDSTPVMGTQDSTPLLRSPFSDSDGLGWRSSAPLPTPRSAASDTFAAQSFSLPATQPAIQPAPQPTLTPPTPTFVFPKRVFQ
jgi:hypothetical protein